MFIGRVRWCPLSPRQCSVDSRCLYRDYGRWTSDLVESHFDEEKEAKGECDFPASELLCAALVQQIVSTVLLDN